MTDSEPWVSGHVDNGRFKYLLAGCTCLAGDIFGNYAFDNPLAIGDQIVFPELGAYTFVKAHRFNGTNLPSIYAKSADGQIALKYHFTFADYATHNVSGRKVDKMRLSECEFELPCHNGDGGILGYSRLIPGSGSSKVPSRCASLSPALWTATTAANSDC